MAIKNFEQLYSLSGDQILPKVQVINNLTTNDATKPLSAAQGVVIKSVLDEYENGKGEGGYAQLDSTGKVPSVQLPSYVDDVVEFSRFITTSPSITVGSVPYVSEVLWVTTTKKFVGYVTSTSKYYSNWSGDDNYPSAESYGTIYAGGITPAKNKIYVCAPKFVGGPEEGKTFRWSGTDLSEISQSLALGETSSTAYAGDKGKAVTDKVSKMLGASWIAGFNDYEQNDTNVAILGLLKEFDANGNPINFDGDDPKVYIPNASTTKAGIITATDYQKIANATPSGTSYTKTESDNKYVTNVYLGPNSKDDGQYVEVVLGNNIQKEFCIPVVPADQTGMEDSCGLMRNQDKVKLDNITTITEAELNTLLV